jgi:hypothetical protein
MNRKVYYANCNDVKLLQKHIGALHHKLVEWNNRAHPEVYETVAQQIVARLIPSTANIFSSIEHLILGGWLYSAETLTRPAVERLATMAYFSGKPDVAVKQWNAGWTTRPSLVNRLKFLPTASNATLKLGLDRQVFEETKTILISLAESMNSAIHGDPVSLEYTISFNRDGVDRYALGPEVDNEIYANNIASVATNALVFLPLIFESFFPNYNSSKVA